MARTNNGKGSQPQEPLRGTGLQQLQELQQILQASLEATGDGILVVDKEGHVVLSNSNFAKMWNIPSGIIETKDDEKLFEIYN